MCAAGTSVSRIADVRFGSPRLAHTPAPQHVVLHWSAWEVFAIISRLIMQLTLFVKTHNIAVVSRNLQFGRQSLINRSWVPSVVLKYHIYFYSNSLTLRNENVQCNELSS